MSARIHYLIQRGIHQLHEEENTIWADSGVFTKGIDVKEKATK